MKLDDYLRRNHLTEAAFAAASGISQQLINLYRRGKTIPRPDNMSAIETATGGAVASSDFYPRQTRARKGRK